MATQNDVILRLRTKFDDVSLSSFIWTHTYFFFMIFNKEINVLLKTGKLVLTVYQWQIFRHMNEFNFILMNNQWKSELNSSFFSF